MIITYSLGCDKHYLDLSVVTYVCANCFNVVVAAFRVYICL